MFINKLKGRKTVPKKPNSVLQEQEDPPSKCKNTKKNLTTSEIKSSYPCSKDMKPRIKTGPTICENKCVKNESKARRQTNCPKRKVNETALCKTKCAESKPANYKDVKPFKVNLMDVGIDIAGFLIEEEIKQSKDVLKNEILKQIAISKELDKHLERQRCIMNSYISNEFNATLNVRSSNISKPFPEPCDCNVCIEAVIEDLKKSAPKCIQQSGFSTTNNKNDTNPFSKQSSFVHSTPKAQEQPFVPCQDNTNTNQQTCAANVEESFLKNTTPNYRSRPVSNKSIITSFRSKSSNLDGYIEDYSSVMQKVSTNILLSKKSTGIDVKEPPNTPVSDGCKAACSHNSIQALEQDTLNFNDLPVKIQKLYQYATEQDGATEVTESLLKNLNTLLKTPLETIDAQPPHEPPEDATELIICNIKGLIHEYMGCLQKSQVKCDAPCKQKSTQYSPSKNTIEYLTKSNSVDISLAFNNSEAEIFKNCKDDTTRIDITMKLHECPNTKETILEIQPHIEQGACTSEIAVQDSLKPNTCASSKSKNPKTSTESLLLYKSSFDSNFSRKFSPYPSKDRTSFPKQSFQKPLCRSTRRKQISQKPLQFRSASVSSRSSTNCIQDLSNITVCCPNKNNVCGISSNINVISCPTSDVSSLSNNESKTSCKRKRSFRKVKNTKKRRPTKKSKGRGKITFSCPSSTSCAPEIVKQCVLSNKIKRESSTTCASCNSCHEKPNVNFSLSPTLTKKQIQKYLNDHIPDIGKDYKSCDIQFVPCLSRVSNIQSSIPSSQRSKYGRISAGGISSTYSSSSSSVEKTSYRSFQVHKQNKKYQRKYLKKDKKSIISKLHANSFSKSRKYSATDSEDNEETSVASNKTMDSIFALKGSEICQIYSVNDSNAATYGSSNFLSSLMLETIESDPFFDKPERKIILKKVTSKSLDSESGKSIKHGKNGRPNFISDVDTSDFSFSETMLRMREKKHKLKMKYSDENLSAAELEQMERKLKHKKKNRTRTVMSKLEERKVQKIESLFAHMYKNNLKRTKKSLGSKIKRKTPKYLQNEISDDSSFDNIKTVKMLSNTGISKEIKVLHEKDKTPKIQKLYEDTAFEEQKTSSDFSLAKSKSVIFVGGSCSSNTDFSFGKSSFSENSIESISDSLLDIREVNHDYLIRELICPYSCNKKRTYFNVSETEKIIKRAFYIQDIFVKLATTETEKNYWREIVLRAMKSIITQSM